MSIINFNEVVKTYGEAVILNNLSFSIPQNSIFGLIGANGVGKTTIIKNILNLVNLTSGSIEINGAKCQNNASRQKVFYLPESFCPPKNLSGYEFLHFYLKILKTPFNQQKTLQYCKMLDLNEIYLSYKILQCSKGTIQKIGLLLAFLSPAELLILDEPSTGLDVKARHSLKNTILHFHSLGGSVFLSSHIFSDLEQTCTHFGIFNNGNFAFFGTKNQILQKQQDLGVESLEQLFLQICGS